MEVRTSDSIRCPFCGGELVFSASEDWPVRDGEADGQANCHECGTTLVFGHFESMDDALEGVKDRMRALDDRLMPEGMEWPRWEDGKKVELGDEFKASDFIDTAAVSSVEVGKNVFVGCMRATRPLYECTHIIQDTQERIDADALKNVTLYWSDCNGKCSECRHSASKSSGLSCHDNKILDLLRRQRELDARGIGNGHR